MKLLLVVGIWAILSSWTCALLAYDAFDQELIKYSINPSNYQVSQGYLLGNINNYQFGKLDLNDNLQVQWSIDLDKLDILTAKFHVSPKVVVVYETSKILLLDISTGVVINVIDIEGSVVTVLDFFSKGVLVQINNSVVFIDNNGEMVDILDFKDGGIKTIFLDTSDGYGLLLINHHLYKLSYDLNLVYDESFHEIPTVFDHGLVITQSHRLFQWNGDKFDLIKSDIQLTHFEIIDSNHLLSVSNDAIVLYAIIDGALVLSHQIPMKSASSTFLTISKGLSNYLIIADEKLKHIYDLTDYLATNDADSIKHVKTHTFGDFEFINNDLQLVSWDSTGFALEKTNLVDGSSIKQPIVHQHSFSSNSIIIDFPQSRENIEKAHTLLEDSDHGFIVSRWFHRIIRHLSELGHFTYSVVTREQSLFGGITKKEYGFEKILVFYNPTSLKVSAIDTISGKQLWTTTVVGFSKILEYNQNILVITKSQLILIDPTSGAVVTAVFETAPVILLSGSTKSNGEVQVRSNLAVQDGDIFKLSDFDKVSSIEDIYFITTGDNTVLGNKISANEIDSHNTWTFKRSNEQIIKVNGKAPTQKTSSIGIPLADKSVLYKYLNPNTVTIITKDLKNNLNVYVIDGISGNVIIRESHTTESIDFDSINIVHDDNWIVYSYFVDSINFEQRINVIDLFDSKKAVATSEELVSTFEANSTLNSYTKKSYIYPEKITSLSSTQSKYGITLKSIIIVTEPGSMMEIPKYILNSRRVDDRELTNDDAISDYKMSPYTPVIPRNTQATLNHKYRLSSNNGVILTKPTDYESTSVVCYINNINCFCTLVKPSSSFDLLSASFDKYKLIATIAIILIAFLVSKPFVADKRLKGEWIDAK